MTTKRTCGGCFACCDVLGVPELNKPAWHPCDHQCDVGCAVYDQRPESCRVFECGWLHGRLEADHRPDKLGAIFALTEDGESPGTWLHVFEIASNGFDLSKILSITRQLFLDLSERGEIAGVEIILHGQTGIVVYANSLDSMERLVSEFLD